MVEDAQFPPAVTADVQSDLVREGGARVRHAQDVDEELAEFEDAAADRGHFRAWVDVRKEDPAHGRAGARGTYDPAVGRQRPCRTGGSPAATLPNSPS